MKKMVLFLAVAALATQVFAEHRSISFLNAKSVTVGTNVLYASSDNVLTNLSAVYAGGLAVNDTYLVWTNWQGARVWGTNSSGTNFNLCGEVELVLPSVVSQPAGGTNQASGITPHPGPWVGNISVTVGPAHASAVGTITFAPVWDGENEDSRTGSRLVFTITPSATINTTVATNIDASMFVGAKALRLLGYTVADGMAYTNVVKAIKYNYFVP